MVVEKEQGVGMAASERDRFGLSAPEDDGE